MRPRERGGSVDIGSVESGPITITVNTLSEVSAVPVISDTVTSLREALAFANFDPYGDTITFAAGLTGTLALTLGPLTITNQFSQITIKGPGAGMLTLDGQGKNDILSIESGANASVSGLTLAHGSASSGGAITNVGTLTIANATLSSNLASTSGGGINNSGTLTLINSTISSNSASGLGGGISNSGAVTLIDSTISSNSASGSGGGISNSGTMTVIGCTISGDSASAPGGGVFNSGTMTLSGSTVSSNTTSGYDGFGGGIDNTKSLSLISCTVVGNTANSGGGIENYGAMVLTGSTIAGNTARGFGTGGGIDNIGTATVNNTTLSGNTASIGGGVYDFGAAIAPFPTVTLDNCTVAGNSSTFGGGIGDSNVNSVVTLNNTIVAMNTGGDISGDVSGQSNLVDNAGTAGGLKNGVNGNLVGMNAKLGDLAWNGGPVQTRALLIGSPAIDAGDNSLVPVGVVTDARGAPRLKGPKVDIGAFESGAWSITVTTLDDSGASSGLSLRGAINEVNTIDPLGGVTIHFAAGLTGTLTLTQGMLPAVAGNLAIIGPGASLLSIDAAGNSGILSINAGVVVSLAGLTFANGTASISPGGAVTTDAGGAIANHGTLVISGCALSGNKAMFGGAIASSGPLNMVNSTLSGNSASVEGGAVYSTGSVTLSNCTISGNTASSEGGGIYRSGYSQAGTTLALAGCTISGNSAPLAGGIAGHNVTMNNTIVANSGSGGDIWGIVSGGNNLIDDAGSAGGLANGVDGNLLGVDPKLGALAYNGGSTETMALLAGSPAIDKGSNSAIPPFLITDQRGAPRAKGSRVDIGAFESGATSIIVSTISDEDNGTIDPFSGAGISLREAIAFASADPGGGDTISFSPLLKGSIKLDLGALPTVSTTLTIDGPGATVLSIDGEGKSGILSLGSGADVTISGLTFAHGSTVKGGAISNAGTLALTDCTLTGNTAQGGVGPDGGAIWSTGTLALTGCTLSANLSLEDGGAIYTSGSTTLTDCTISGNSASSQGGGIYRSGYSQAGTTLALADCTISGNSAPLAGGIAGHNVTMNNTIVANSGSGGDIWGIVSGSNNLIEDAGSSGGLANGVSGNLVGVDPMLGVLAYNGGPTQTMALLAGSRAIGAGDSTLLPSGVTTDQRGFALDSPKSDIGAFQYQGPAPSVTITGPTAATAQVESTFTLTASDPSPNDQNGTFTYTIDWNGDGSDVQTIVAPASAQVTHSYSVGGTFSPSVTVLDKQNRVSNPAVLAAPVAVTGFSNTAVTNVVTTGPITISASSTLLASTAMDAVNNVPASAWSGSNSATIVLANLDPVADIVINPTSSSAQVNISPYDTGAIGISQLVTVTNPYASGGSEGLTIAATVIAAVWRFVSWWVRCRQR